MSVFHCQKKVQVGQGGQYLLIDLGNFSCKLAIKIGNVAIEVVKMLNDPGKDTLESLGGVLQSKDLLEVEGTLERDFL